MIDSHAHLDFPDFDARRSDILQRFEEAGGEIIINVGCDIESSKRSVALAEKHSNVYAAIGIHPHEANTLSGATLKELEKLVVHPRVVAVGEIGMDFFREPRCSPQVQEAAFEKQLELAATYHKPIIIHCRETYDEVLEILKRYQPDNWQGVLHCFTNTPAVAESFLALGFHVGFTGTITYQKPGGEDEKQVRETLRMMPQERLLVETDCPYLAPIPHRGQMNEPALVKNIIEKIAEMRGEAYEEIEKQTSQNARALFGIK